jgi:hypothetical protein
MEANLLRVVIGPSEEMCLWIMEALLQVCCTAIFVSIWVKFISLLRFRKRLTVWSKTRVHAQHYNTLLSACRHTYCTWNSLALISYLTPHDSIPRIELSFCLLQDPPKATHLEFHPSMHVSRAQMHCRQASARSPTSYLCYCQSITLN